MAAICRGSLMTNTKQPLLASGATITEASWPALAWNAEAACSRPPAHHHAPLLSTIRRCGGIAQPTEFVLIVI